MHSENNYTFAKEYRNYIINLGDAKCKIKKSN